VTTRFIRSISAALLCVHCVPEVDLGRGTTGDVSSPVEEGVQPGAPCAGGVLAVQDAHWTCVGGLWTQLEDDTWNCPDHSQSKTQWVVKKTNDKCGSSDDGGASSSEDPATPTGVISCMGQCPTFPGCIRIAVSPNACSNADCTGPDPECGYAQDPNSDTRCLDGEIMHATGSCIPSK
jgi:hypothetical protein